MMINWNDVMEAAIKCVCVEHGLYVGLALATATVRKPAPQRRSYEHDCA